MPLTWLRVTWRTRKTQIARLFSLNAPQCAFPVFFSNKYCKREYRCSFAKCTKVSRDARLSVGCTDHQTRDFAYRQGEVSDFPLRREAF
jgi:hypothetical protein